VLRFALVLVLSGSVAAFGQAPAQESSSQPQPEETAIHPVSPEVLEAEAAIVKADWETAEAKLTPWLVEHPTDARALFAAGFAADAQNHNDAAVAFYRRAVEADPRSFEAHLSLGLLLARQKDFDAARPELALATTLDPGSADPALKARAWRALARIDEADNPTEASDDLLQALKLTPETEQDTLMAASLADRSGEYEAAEAAYRRVLARNPKSAEANAGIASLLIARKDYPEAETALRAALEQTPDDPVLTAQLAAALAAQDKGEALPLLEKLHQMHQDDKSITRMLAEVRAESGDTEGSDKLYLSLLAANPEDAVLLVGHGQNLVHLFKYKEAFVVFDKATKLDPTSAEAWSGLAFMASKIEQPSITLNALAMRSKYLPEVPETYYLWATAYDTLHDKAAAVSYYHRFLESSAGKMPTQEWRAHQRLIFLEGKK
jgi:tetratricopeptide (TPR) repeat protein